MRDFSLAVIGDSYVAEGYSETTQGALDPEEVNHASTRLHPARAARQIDDPYCSGQATWFFSSLSAFVGHGSFKLSS